MKNRYLYIIVIFLIFVIGIFTVSDYLKRISSTPPSTQNILLQNEEVKKSTGQMTIGNVLIAIEIADTPARREQGLSNRETLDEDSGMLFVFDSYSTPYFWMREMMFPLDIIWIKDNKIVDIDKNLPIPKSDTLLPPLPKYSPSEKVNYVLEVNAGFADKNKLKIGDTVEFKY